MLRRLGAFFFTFYVLLNASVTLTVLALTVILLRFLGMGRRAQTPLIRAWCKGFLWSIGVRYIVEGRENDVPDHPSLVVSNHQSLLDIPLAFAAVGGHLRMVAKKELFWVPFFGLGMLFSDYIFVDRGSPASRQRTAQKIADRIRKGIRVWVAPEGTRSPDGKLREFRIGSFKTAILAQAWVQPLVVCNAHEVLPKKHFRFNLSKVIRLKVLPPISTEGMGTQQAAQLMEQVHSAMAAALQE